jgi:putative transposase
VQIKVGYAKRGINRRRIFKDECDRDKFIQTLQYYSVVSEYEVYVYCLRGNHLHLLIKVGKEPLVQLTLRICRSYVYWYNRNYLKKIMQQVYRKLIY